MTTAVPFMTEGPFSRKILSEKDGRTEQQKSCRVNRSNYVSGEEGRKKVKEQGSAMLQWIRFSTEITYLFKNKLINIELRLKKSLIRNVPRGRKQ